MDIQLRGSVLGVFGSLFFAGTAEIPEHDLAVITGTGEHSLLERMPGDRRDGVTVAFKSV